MKTFKILSVALFAFIFGVAISIATGFNPFATVAAVGAISLFASVPEGSLGFNAMGTRPALRDRGRAIFKSLKDKYPNNTISEGFLRIEQPLSNSSGTYAFTFKKQDIKGTKEKQQIGLDMNDRFVCTDLLICIAAVDTTKPGIAVLQTYPNLQAFVAATGFVPAHLEAIYAGSLQYQKGKTVSIESFPMLKFRQVPQTQQSSGSNNTLFDLQSMVVPLNTHINLTGSGAETIQINVPVFNGIQFEAVATNIENRIVVIPFGYLIKDANKLVE